MDSEANRKAQEELQEQKKKEEEKKEETLLKNLLFTKSVPLDRWQSKSSAILNIPYENKNYWVYFSLNKPRNPERLNVQSQNRSETIFFNIDSKKILRVADDSLTWSYYTQGPFQRIESGVWLPITPAQAGSQPETFVVKGLEDEIYEYDNGTGMVINEILKDKKAEEEKKESSEEQESGQGSTLDLEALKKKAKTIDADTIKKNKKVWKEAEGILEKLNKQKDMKAFREAVIKGQEILEIKGNYIVETFEELFEVYDLKFEYCRTGESSNTKSIFPVNGMNEAKFVMGVIIPELCLYPKSLFKELGIKTIQFCGNIMLARATTPVGFSSTGEWINLNCGEKNIIKIQQSIHQAIFSSMLFYIKKDLPDFTSVWRSLSPPDFEYSINRKKVPKGLKGFLSLRATQYVDYDMEEIYFALMKNPPTILNHSDIIIAKKGHLVKNVIDAKYPGTIDEEWWNYVTDYKDIIELSLGSTEYFKEAHFAEEEVEAK